jgi:hypothetical protein
MSWRKISYARDQWIVYDKDPRIADRAKIWTFKTPKGRRYVFDVELKVGKSIDFPTKSQALAYAKDWMQKHPHGLGNIIL